MANEEYYSEKILRTPITDGIEQERLRYNDIMNGEHGILTQLKPNIKARNSSKKFIVGSSIALIIVAFLALVEVYLPAAIFALPSLLVLMKKIPTYRKSLEEIVKLKAQKAPYERKEIDRTKLEYSLRGFNLEGIERKLKELLDTFIEPEDSVVDYRMVDNVNYLKKAYEQRYGTVSPQTIVQPKPSDSSDSPKTRRLYNDEEDYSTIFSSDYNGYADTEFGYHKPHTR